MANIKTLYGSDKLREMYPKVNENFNAVNGEVNDVRNRVDNIITTPIGGETAAQEVVDARQSAVKEKTFATLDARIEEAEQDHKTHMADDVSHLLKYGGILGDSTIDFNIITANRMYQVANVTGASNAPPVNFGILLYFYDNRYSVQLFFNVFNTCFVRTKSETEWTAWKQFWLT